MDFGILRLPWGGKLRLQYHKYIYILLSKKLTIINGRNDKKIREYNIINWGLCPSFDCSFCGEGLWGDSPRLLDLSSIQSHPTHTTNAHLAVVLRQRDKRRKWGRNVGPRPQAGTTPTSQIPANRIKLSEYYYYYTVVSLATTHTHTHPTTTGPHIMMSRCFFFFGEMCGPEKRSSARRGSCGGAAV